MPCRFQEAGICECPGGKDFEPVEGTINLENGIHCLDFPNILLPYKLAFTPRKLPGGRHVTNVMESMEKLDKARKKYQRSPKGKAARQRYRDSKKGQKVARERQDSPKFKLSRQKYVESQKGQDVTEKQKERKKDWRKAHKWLNERPGKTYEDYCKEVEGD